MAIDGGSAGGYTTLCCLAFSDVFRAGCSKYGISDLKALYHETHKVKGWQRPYIRHAKMFCWPMLTPRVSRVAPLSTNPQFESRYMDGLIGPITTHSSVYDARCPINHLEGFNCPALFLQGSEDKVVPPNQSRMMFDALKAKVSAREARGGLRVEAKKRGDGRRSSLLHKTPPARLFSSNVPLRVHQKTLALRRSPRLGFQGLDTAMVIYSGEQHGFRKDENRKHSVEVEEDFFNTGELRPRAPAPRGILRRKPNGRRRRERKGRLTSPPLPRRSFFSSLSLGASFRDAGGRRREG